MSAEIKLSDDNTCLKISGALNVKTVVSLRQKGSQLLKTLTNVVIDLEKVTEYDSTALALLTALARDAKKAGKQARFVQIPPQLMAIAKLSALDKVLTM